MKITLIASIFLAASATAQTSQTPHGQPGIVPNWSSAKKVQVGTSNTWEKSLVWFTNAQGVLTETYFPTIDKAQIKDAQILVSDNRSFMVEERTQTRQSVEVLSPSLVKLKNADYKDRFEISHTFFTLGDDHVLVDEVEVVAKVDGLHFYNLVNPALNNTGFHDNGHASPKALVFWEGDTRLSVKSTTGFEKASVGYVGFTDGYQDLVDNNGMDQVYGQAFDGNLAGLGKLKLPSKKGTYRFYIVYDFAGERKFSEAALAQAKTDYNESWNSYLAGINTPSGLNKTHKDLYLRSMYTLRVHEDKLAPGAFIASLSKPWGEETFEYPGVMVGGYHLVWPRDLYHVCAAYINAGDLDAPLRALNYLKRIQYQDGTWNYDGRQIERRGAFPQNVWTDGNEYWGGFQLDQAAYPVHIFYQLWERGDQNRKRELVEKYGEMAKLSLDFIKKYGPWSAQERWEENFGISPSSFAAATAALYMGERVFGDSSYAHTANGWLTKPGDNIHTWTFTNKGVYEDGQYYIRVAGCDSHTGNWNPNNGAWCTIANSGERREQTEILDQGFLKLSLQGLVKASDWRIKHSLEILNKHIKVETPNGHGWYRYSYDAYGEDKRGRIWPLLSSEHGRYYIERFKAGDMSWSDASAKVDEILASYKGFANEGDMIPEQVFEHNGEGTGAATPLAWSHAEYIKLLWSKHHKRNVENLLN